MALDVRPGPLTATTPSTYLGIEVGGTKLQLALGRGDGRIIALERRVIRPEAGAKALLVQIAEAQASLVGRGDEPPIAVGIGFGGPVDADRGVILRSHQVEGWDGFPLVPDWARGAFGIPLVAVENDADTAGLGEAQNGAGRGLSPIFYVTIGSGIGGALILDGKIYRGSGLGASEIGHLQMDELGEAPRTLESIASGWSIGQAGRAAFDAPMDAPAVARLAETGDPRAIAILANATQSVGRALAHVVTLLAPRRIILGGGVSLLGEPLWFGPIREELEARAFPPFRGTFDLVPALLGEEVVLHGSLALARDIHQRRMV